MRAAALRLAARAAGEVDCHRAWARALWEQPEGRRGAPTGAFVIALLVIAPSHHQALLHAPWLAYYCISLWLHAVCAHAATWDACQPASASPHRSFTCHISEHTNAHWRLAGQGRSHACTMGLGTAKCTWWLQMRLGCSGACGGPACFNAAPESAATAAWCQWSRLVSYAGRTECRAGGRGGGAGTPLPPWVPSWVPRCTGEARVAGAGMPPALREHVNATTTDNSPPTGI